MPLPVFSRTICLVRIKSCRKSLRRWEVSGKELFIVISLAVYVAFCHLLIAYSAVHSFKSCPHTGHGPSKIPSL